jgi:hypothetical protein
MPRRVRDQVREALERDGVAVTNELGDRFPERYVFRHYERAGTASGAEPANSGASSKETTLS